MGKKSVGVELKKKKTYQSQQRLLSDWAANWENDQRNVIDILENAVRSNNRGDIFYMLDQLKGMTDKRFTALNNVLRIMSDMDRVLVDERVRLENVNDDGSIDSESMNSSDNMSCGINDNAMSQDREKFGVNINKIKDIDFEEIAKCYQSGMSINELAAYNNMSNGKIVKILVTIGVYSSDVYDKVKEMREEGRSDWEIMDRLDINKNELNRYTPYQKSIYNLSNPSKNALKIRKTRKNKKTIEKNEEV